MVCPAMHTEMWEHAKVHDGSLPAVRLGAGRAALRIDSGELEAWLEAQSPGAKAMIEVSIGPRRRPS